MRAIILCYHKVGPRREEGRRLNVAPERLKSHVSYFQRVGYRFVRAGDLSRDWTGRTVCLSFDDAYWSTFEWGLPVLDSFGVPGTVFAVSSLVGRSSTWDASNPRPLAGWDSLRDAQGRGHEIGNHTSSHARLTDLSDESQNEEIRAADQSLRDSGLAPASFCYPYGSFDGHSLEAVKACGYRVGLALGKRIAEDFDDRLALPRIVVAFSDALPMLLYKLFLRPRLRRKD